MICYKDTTYCVSKDCVNRNCKIRMTDEIQEKAMKLCIPVSLSDETKTCRYYVGKGKGNEYGRSY